MTGSDQPQHRRHKVFVSFHHGNDQRYKDRFERLFSSYHDILVRMSVQMGDIHRNTNTERIRQIIRENYLRDSTVTVVLIGTDTWKRKHVDWEIAASIRHTSSNPRSGLLGIILPAHHNFGHREYDPYTIPPRLHYNVARGFAAIHHWSTSPQLVGQWIHNAFQRRNSITPDNSFPSFRNNRNGERWQP